MGFANHNPEASGTTSRRAKAWLTAGQRKAQLNGY